MYFVMIEAFSQGDGKGINYFDALVSHDFLYSTDRQHVSFIS